jgi:hypothetical protein
LAKEALVYRAIATMKNNKYRNVNVFAKDFKERPLAPPDFLDMPPAERSKVCADLHLANETDWSELYIQRMIPFSILELCAKYN